jgi:hypothetical protein
MLRVTSVLYLCSAFENTISAYFILCGLFDPKAVIATWSGERWPLIRRTPADLASLMTQLTNKASGMRQVGGILGGVFSKRITTLETTFGLALNVPGAAQTALDKHYGDRHKIAHDQSMAQSDQVLQSTPEATRSRLAVSETEWRALAGVFDESIEAIEAGVLAHVGRKYIVSLAVARFVDRV